MHQAAKNCGWVAACVCVRARRKKSSNFVLVPPQADVTLLWNIPRVLFCCLFQLLSCCTRRKHAYLGRWLGWLLWLSLPGLFNIRCINDAKCCAAALIVIKSNSPLARAAWGKERWRQTRFIFHPRQPPAYLKIKSAGERALCLWVRACTSRTFSWLRAHNNHDVSWGLIFAVN
jgi:hypothetical protein